MSILHTPAIRHQPGHWTDAARLRLTSLNIHCPLSIVWVTTHEAHHCCYDTASHCLSPSRNVTCCHADRLSLTDTACVSRAPVTRPAPPRLNPVLCYVQCSELWPELACFACNPTPGLVTLLLLSSVSNINCLGVCLCSLLVQSLVKTPPPHVCQVVSAK